MIRRLEIEIPQAEVAAFCRKWKVSELCLFGSAVDGGMSLVSDVDVMVSFEPGAAWDLVDAAQMEQELETIFARPVDLVTRRAVETSTNPIRRDAILRSATPIYVA